MDCTKEAAALLAPEVVPIWRGLPAESGCEETPSLKELYPRAALKELLEKGLFRGIGRIQVAKVSITQLSANKEEAIPTSAHSQEPKFGHQWEVLIRHTQKAAWERKRGFWG